MAYDRDDSFPFDFESNEIRNEQYHYDQINFNLKDL